MKNNDLIDSQGNILLSEDERTQAEVWTRVMDYHRPVSFFNEGKKSEHEERQFFKENRINVDLSDMFVCSLCQKQFSIEEMDFSIEEIYCYECIKKEKLRKCKVCGTYTDDIYDGELCLCCNERD